ncbi:MAG TPA: RluA family pseudouridine synthase [Armatimonadota bacterium]|jgi:23S rRNA pseudouridine1911/1915/1917 synthase
MSEVLLVSGELAGQRLDVALAALLPDVSRSAAHRMIRDGGVHLNGRPAKPKDIVQEADELALDGLVQGNTPSAAPEDLPLDIVYEDDILLVVNKPQGMTTHPAPGSPSGTLVNALMGRGITLSDEGGELRPGIVHRLDKDTSGLLVVAKNSSAHRFLARQLADRTLSRRYVAIVWGVPRWKHAHVDAPIGRHPTNRLKMAVVTPPDGRSAVTDLDVLEPLGAMALVRARLQSGRTHQIRVHVSYAGHPVLGDPLYGGERPGHVRLLPPSAAEAITALNGQALHAARLAFVHPTTREPMSFEAPPPAPFMRVLAGMQSGFTVESLLAAVRADPPPEQILS